MRELSPRQFEGGSSTEAFQETGTQVLSINAFIAPTSPTEPRSPKSPGPSVMSRTVSTSAPSAGPSGRRFMAGPESDHSVSSNGSGLSVRNPNNLNRPAFSRFPTASVRRSAKEIEAGLSTSNSLDSEYFDNSSEITSRVPIERSRSAVAAAGPSDRGLPVRSASVGASGAQDEVIFQHQDADILRELPPPYADRGRSES
ncbi:hypothetical protein K438DRAFT_1853847 [Mycena galopus ATCC 62051]|nr:hypothetical protein K438DRAFT_1853847 [Mycena galopus ATCC 62051]